MSGWRGAAGAWRAMPGSLWALGVGSLLMDASSELIHALLPVFLTVTLGASMLTVGVIEGFAEATAAIVKVFSGALSDYIGRRKFLLVSGYALAAITKPVFPLAGSVGWVFAARFVDRVGKGIRGAPRDALVADLVDPPRRGAAYGLRQGLDTAGAILGPLLALVLMIAFARDIRAAMWFAVVPATLCVGLLIACVREPGPAAVGEKRVNPLGFAQVRRLPLRFWAVVSLGSVFTLARFSEAFLVLRAQDAGFGLQYVPLVMVVMNVFHAAAAYPAGVAADHVRSSALLLTGLALLIGADLLLAAATSPLVVLAGAALWGLHLAFTQGLLAKLVADAVAAERRGTAFGLFNLASGGALLLASVIAGALWSAQGAAATFLASALFATLAAAGLLWAVHGRSGRRPA